MFSTFNELHMILDAHKPFFLIKMCVEFEAPETRPLLPKSAEKFVWHPESNRRSDLPADLLKKILVEFTEVDNARPKVTKGVASVPVHQTGAKPEKGPVRALGLLKELQRATREKNFAQIVQLLDLQGKAVLRVALEACKTVAILAMDDDVRDKLVEAGACEKVVAILAVLGVSNLEVAAVVCFLSLAVVFGVWGLGGLWDPCGFVLKNPKD